MKKLLILAVLLGLTGCGDNNQSDTTQTNTRENTLQKAEASPAVANYSLAAAPRTFGAVAPLAGWGVTNSTVMGASTLIDAAKGNLVSAALITPNAKQVAEALRGGVAGIALSIAVDQLLGAVDWVLDPENSRIKYKYNDPMDCGVNGEKCPTLKYLLYGYYDKVYVKYRVDMEYAKAVCIAHIPKNNTSQKFLKVENLDYTGFSCKFDGSGQIRTSWGQVNNPAYNPNNEEKYLSLETVAEQVISNADAGSLDAQVATNLATQNILNDVVQAEPVVQDLENNSKNNCPSGIINKKGDCWVCSRESYTPIRGRVIYAKEIVGGLGKCDSSMNSSQLLTRRNAYAEFGSARDAENSCWSPPDGFHLSEASEAKRIANDCNTFLGVLGQ